jgi:hypothetical protein
MEDKVRMHPNPVTSRYDQGGLVYSQKWIQRRKDNA